MNSESCRENVWMPDSYEFNRRPEISNDLLLVIPISELILPIEREDVDR